MGYCINPAGVEAGKGCFFTGGLAGGAGVFYLFTVCLANRGNRQFTKRVAFIGNQFQNPGRTGWDAFAAPVTFVRIYGDKEIAGAVFVTVVGKHNTIDER